jgi:hypothetical protein
MQIMVRLWAVFISVGIIAAQNSTYPTQTLWPAGAFDINKNLRARGVTSAMTVHQLVAKQKHLYFVLSPGPTPESSTLVRTDLSGGIEQIIFLGPDYIRNIDVDDKLNIFVLSLPPKADTVLAMYDTDGKRVYSLPAPALSYKVMAVQDKVFNLLSDGSAKLLRSPTSTVPFRTLDMNVTNLRFVALPNYELATTDGVEADLQIASLDKGTVRIAPLSALDISSVRTDYRQTINNPLLKGVTVLGLAADEKGFLYFMLSGFKAHESMKIVKVDTEGNTKAVLKMLLPPRENGSGLMIPSELVIVAGQVFILDRSGTVALFYLGW